MGEEEIREIEITDQEYPQILREIPDPPKKLFVRGNINWPDKPMIAVVGTRKQTAYGVQVTKQLVGAIASQACIVSGLAYGTDALAHKTALENGGLTWAVLGTGIDDASIYPAANRGLAWDILKSGGALISEQPPGAKPLPHHFPLRNRIIAGLSSKVVVIEAAAESGALITGKLGLDYNRDVLAVPGPITSPESRGTNQLISEGAKPVLGPSDILEIEIRQTVLNLTGPEEIVYKALGSGAKTVDELVLITKLTPSEINAILTLMEMQGTLVSVSGGSFAIK